MTSSNHTKTPSADEKKINTALNFEELQVGWTNVLTRMRHDLGDTQWRCWIKNLKIIGQKKEQLIIGAESNMIKTRVSSQYEDRLLANCKIEWGDVDRLEIKVLRGNSTFPDRPQRATEIVKALKIAQKSMTI